jgi:hypothetical protein
LEYSKVLPGSCEEWIISEFLQDVVLNQGFKRCGCTEGLPEGRLKALKGTLWHSKA